MSDRIWRVLVIGWFVCLALVPAEARQAKGVLTDRADARTLRMPDAGPSFSFVVLADVTQPGPNNVDVLRKTVGEVNLLGPDLVFNVGDLIRGYGDRDQWLAQTKEIRQVMDGLAMPWFPVPGNHDIYWGGKQARPSGEHEPDYERDIGPLWYAVRHKGCWFIALFSDEGDPKTGKKSFSDPNAQVLSPRQTRWLESTLKKAKGSSHIFVFIHQPRWTGGEYGQDWGRIYPMLSKAGVSAVFGGHHHLLSFDGVRDGVRYYRLGTTGGTIDRDLEPDGFHHYLQVTVHPKDFSVAVIKVGSVYDPRDGQFRRWLLLPRQDWQIGPDRRLDFRIETPDMSGLDGLLQIGVVHSIDEWGDKGLEVQVLDRDGNPVHSQFISDKGTIWVRCPVKENTRYMVQLYDKDTQLGDQRPGNQGSISVRLRARPPAPLGGQ